MNIGDYVRTKDGLIRKIINIGIENDYIFRERYGNTIYFDNNSKALEKEVECKSSPNIIDLIEVGDYVNGLRVNDKGQSVLIFYDGDGDYYLDNENIKSIVTKEQFESMEYKVGE